MNIILNNLKNKNGSLSQIQVFLILVIPIIIILSIIMAMGEYWYRAQVLDEYNARFLSTILKQGAVTKVPGGYDTSELESLIESFYSGSDSVMKSLLGESTLTFKVKIDGVEEVGLTPSEFIRRVGANGLGRNDNRQDYVGSYIRSNKPALLDIVLKGGFGWFSYGGSGEVKYQSYLEGDVEQWIE